MNQKEFLEYIGKVHDKITEIATENGYAILLTAHVSDEANGTDMVWSTNMTPADVLRNLSVAPIYFHLNGNI